MFAKCRYKCFATFCLFAKSRCHHKDADRIYRVCLHEAVASGCFFLLLVLASVGTMAGSPIWYTPAGIERASR
jgi:hypothetical protein